jgi:ribosomal protein S18 acetylase RimI-like enzyme
MIIRKADNKDVKPAAELMASSMGHFGDELLGLGSHEVCLDMLRRLIVLPDHRFSLEFAHVAEIDSQVAGLLLAFPGTLYNRLQINLFRPMRQVYSLRQLFRLAWRGLPQAFDKETDTDQFYIAHLATSPEFRQRGIGQALMEKAEELAKKAGIKACSLIVELGNDPARRLYQRLSYKVIQTVNTRALQKLGTPGYERRVKSLI